MAVMERDVFRSPERCRIAATIPVDIRRGEEPMSSARIRLCFSLIALLLTVNAVAADPRPMELAVDATDAPRGVFHSRLVIPAAPGTLTLAYPKWVQGEHAPSGPIQQVAGFTVSAGGRVLPWRRDPLDAFLVKVEVPAGAAA